MNNIKKFFTLSIDPDSGYTGFNDIIEKAMSDPKFAKIYPVITNLKLLEELIRFIQSPPRKIKGVGIANGEIFRKENGRQVSGSHRYLGVLEEDGTYNLYKKFKGGPSDGQIWLILRAQDESCQTTKFILEYAKTIGNMPRIRDVEDYFSRNKILICRDRIQIILNHCHDSIIIASKKTNLDYDVSKLSFSIPQQENRNPSSDVAIGVAKAQQEKESESSTDIVLLNKALQKKPLKRPAKPNASNTMSSEPKMTPIKTHVPRQTETIKSRTPMVNRLRKRKAPTSITNEEDNPRATLQERNGGPMSSIVSKKCRRK